MQQCFVEFVCQLNQEIELNLQQSHHLASVLRMRNGEVVRIVDSSKQVFLAKITSCFNLVRVLCVEQVLDHSERQVPVTLLIGLIKKEKWDFCLQKSTELGVSRIIPFESMRTVVKKNEEKSNRKRERWQKIVTEAAQQCKRCQIPIVEETISLKQAALYKSAINLVAYEGAGSDSHRLREVCDQTQSITIVIGPEGGFDSSEIEFLQDFGFQCITLGGRILRAETAALYALSAIDALIE